MCLYLFSNIFSTKTVVPSATHAVASKGACASVGKPGNGIVLIVFIDLSLSGAFISRFPSEILILHPAFLKIGISAARWDEIIQLSIIFEPVTAAQLISVAATILSGIIVWTEPQRELTPSMTTTPSPAPEISAPQELR